MELGVQSIPPTPYYGKITVSLKRKWGEEMNLGKQLANVCYIYLGTIFPNDSSFHPGFHFVLYYQPNGLRGNFAILISPMLSYLQ